VACKGLYVNLNGFGIFMTCLLGLALGLIMTMFAGFPINVAAQWYTIVGTFVGLFAAFDRV
jgi:hypothetical protein